MHVFMYVPLVMQRDQFGVMRLHASRYVCMCASYTVSCGIVTSCVVLHCIELCCGTIHACNVSICVSGAWDACNIIWCNAMFGLFGSDAYIACMHVIYVMQFMYVCNACMCVMHVMHAFVYACMYIRACLYAIHVAYMRCMRACMHAMHACDVCTYACNTCMHVRMYECHAFMCVLYACDACNVCTRCMD